MSKKLLLLTQNNELKKTSNDNGLISTSCVSDTSDVSNDNKPISTSDTSDYMNYKGYKSFKFNFRNLRNLRNARGSGGSETTDGSKSQYICKTYEVERINFYNHSLNNKSNEILVRKNTNDMFYVSNIFDDRIYYKEKYYFGVRSHETWIDIGAHIGLFSLFVLDNFAKVICYEPDYENHKLLLDNLINYRSINDNFSIHKCAVIYDDTKSSHVTGSFYIDNSCINIDKGINIDSSDPSYTSDTSDPSDNCILADKGNLIQKNNYESEVVVCVDIRKIISEHNPHCIKISINGLESDILESITLKEWKKTNVRKLVFVYNIDEANTNERFLNLIIQLKEYFKYINYDYYKYRKQYYVYCICPAKYDSHKFDTNGVLKTKRKIY